MMIQSLSLQRVADSEYGIFLRDTQSNSEAGASNPISGLLLISFNVASAVCLIATIIFDGWRLSRKSLSAHTEIIQFIRPGEIVTLSIAGAIAAQGIIFLAVQSVELSSSTSSNCNRLGEIIFPALWLVGSVIFVFGIETLYRGFQRIRFVRSKKGSFYICWAAILFVVLVLWVPTQTRRSTLESCSFGLIEEATPWSDVAFGASIVLIASYILIASILAAQLSRSEGVDPAGRIAASQMIYYLGIAAVTFIFFLPFWVEEVLDISGGTAHMMAMVSINVTGIILSFFQLIFRSYTSCMTIQYTASFRWGSLGSWKAGIKNKISAPIAFQQDETPLFNGRRSLRLTPGNDHTINVDKSLPPTPRIIQKQKGEDFNTATYSIFPTKSSARQMPYPVSSIYEDNNFLMPPKPAFAAHNRNSSDVSHTTVQIGLRLSNVGPSAADMALNEGPAPLLSPWAQDVTINMSTTSLDVPVTLRSPAVEQPPKTLAEIIPSRLRASTRPSSRYPGLISYQEFSVDNYKNIEDSIDSPTIYKKLDDLQKLLDVDLKAAQRAASSRKQSWPLRDSLPVHLPNKTYHPGTEDDNLF